MEKIPAESGPWTMGVLKTCQVWPRSGEWKTRAALPPVANQILGSGSEAASFSEGSRGAEASLFHGCAGGGAMRPAVLVAPAKPRFLAALGMTEEKALGMTEEKVGRRSSDVRMGIGVGVELDVGVDLDVSADGDGRIAKQLLLAAKAPSPSIAGGRLAGRSGVQVWPSVVWRSSNFSWPDSLLLSLSVSSGMGSPKTMPWVRSQKSMESKKPLGFLLVNWSCQVFPASVVW